MSKLMFLTVGISLFQSATWDREKGPAASIPEYDRWFDETGGYLGSPKKRASFSAPAHHLETALTENNAEEWAECLPPNLVEKGTDPEPLRYSAELTTILKLAELAGEAEAGSARALLESYDHVYVAVDDAYDPDSRTRPSFVAGTHLVEYLNRLVPKEVAELLPIRGLASRESAPLIQGVRALARRTLELFEKNDALQLDLVVTGGFKLYGYLLAPLTRAIEGAVVRMIYMHEEGRDLVRLTATEVYLGEQAWPWPQGGCDPSLGDLFRH